MCGKACGTGRGQFKRAQRSRTPVKSRPKGVLPGNQCGVAPLAKGTPLTAGLGTSRPKHRNRKQNPYFHDIYDYCSQESTGGSLIVIHDQYGAFLIIHDNTCLKFFALDWQTLFFPSISDNSLASVSTSLFHHHSHPFKCNSKFALTLTCCSSLIQFEPGHDPGLAIDGAD